MRPIGHMILLGMLVSPLFAQEAVPGASATPTAVVVLTPVVSLTPESSLLTPQSPLAAGTVESGDVPTLTPTSTETPTMTPTSSPTVTSTPTPTVTSTSTPGIVSFSVEPKVLKEKVQLRWELSMPVDQAVFKVYTSSFRLVKTRRYTKATDPNTVVPGPVVVDWDVRDDRGKPLSPGMYFLYLKVKSGRNAWEARDQARVP